MALLALPLGCGPDPIHAPRPRGILLVSIDTLRADHCSAYGYARPTTPPLDRLAREGVLFERCFSPTSWTLPAHLSMLTGLGIDAHAACDDRLWDRVDRTGQRVAPPLKGTFVSEVLSAAGWATAGFYTWKYLEDTFGFGAGFDVWERVGHDFFSHPEIGAEFLRLRRENDVEGMKALAAKHPELLEPARLTSPQAIDAAQQWLTKHLEDDAARPFFLFVHLFDAHDPYTPPADFDRFGDPAYTGRIDGLHVTSPDSPVRGDMEAPDLERLISLYDGGILWVDSEVGRLLAHLESLGLERDTLVVLTSDHGEEFYDHGQKVHRRQLFVESTRVPLVMRWPAGIETGERVSQTVGLVDLAPTFLAAAREGSTTPMEGANLLPLARGGKLQGERTYASLLWRFEAGDWIERQVGLVTGAQHELLSYAPDRAWTGATFDLDRDPTERSATPFAGDDARGRAALERLGRLARRSEALRGRLPVKGATLPSLTDLDKSQLAAMGYTGVAEERAPSTGTAEALGSVNLCSQGCVWQR
jgi:arylsulfatase A-like enzyme